MLACDININVNKGEHNVYGIGRGSVPVFSVERERAILKAFDYAIVEVAKKICVYEDTRQAVTLSTFLTVLMVLQNLSIPVV